MQTKYLAKGGNFKVASSFVFLLMLVTQTSSTHFDNYVYNCGNFSVRKQLVNKRTDNSFYCNLSCASLSSEVVSETRDH